MNTDDIREKLNELLGGVSEKEWNFLWEERYLDCVRDGEMTIHEIVDMVGRYREAFGSTNSPVILNGPAMMDAAGKAPVSTAWAATARRLCAISTLLAREAEQDPTVVAFRQEVLNNELLSPEHVDAWVRQQAGIDGKSTGWLEVPLPPGTDVKLDPTTGHLSVNPPFVIADALSVTSSIKLLMLDYGVFNSQRGQWLPGAVPISIGGILERLRGVSTLLSHHYSWHKAQATIFVLTGLIPFVPALESEMRFRSPFQVTSRIILTIDPALSPREVAEEYRRIRRNVATERNRPLSEKHSELALFAAARSQAETWDERRKEWNRIHREKHPEWCYDQVSNFARDCAQAQRRLLHPVHNYKGIIGNLKEAKDNG